MTSFYYYDQNPSGFCDAVLIRAFVIQTSLALDTLLKFLIVNGELNIFVISMNWDIQIFAAF